MVSPLYDTGSVLDIINGSIISTFALVTVWSPDIVKINSPEILLMMLYDSSMSGYPPTSVPLSDEPVTSFESIAPVNETLYEASSLV